MHKKYTNNIVVSAVLLTFSQQAYAAVWAERTGGDAIGQYADGATTNWEWSWAPGGVDITGDFSLTRSGAGVTYATWETMGDTIDASGFSSPEFDNSPYAVSVGGVDGISHFVSDGELSRAPNDVAIFSTYTAQAIFTFDNGFSSPENTLISFFDPGAFESQFFTRVDGPFTYTFTATNNGVAVDTSSWTLRIEDPYNPANNATNDITWDGTTLTVDNFTGGNFPDTIVFLDTQNTTFDSLTVDAAGMSIDTFAIGFGANTAPIPEPTSIALLGLGGLALLSRRKRA